MGSAIEAIVAGTNSRGGQTAYDARRPTNPPHLVPPTLTLNPMAPTPATETDQPRPSFNADSANLLTAEALLAAAPTVPELADEIALLRARIALLTRATEEASPQEARANTASWSR